MSKLEQLIQELCPKGVSQYRIDEICDISRGRVMSKDYIRDNAGDYPVYSSQTENNGELGKISTYDFDGEYLTWTTDGANAGTVFYRSEKFSITNVCGLIKIKRENILCKYLYYALNIEAPNYVSSGMGNPKLMSNVMARIKVFVPPLEVQREIVRILDNFTELTAELEKELAERKKQYTYYRDTLLSFETRGYEVSLRDETESKRIGALTFYEQPSKYIVKNTNYNDSFDIPVLTAGQSFILGYTNEKDGLYRATKEEPVIIFDDFTGAFKWVDFTFKVKSSAMKIIKSNTNLMMLRYLYYVMGFLNYSSDEHKRLWISKYSNIIIHVPSLETQQKIVDILDNFAKITEELKKEIELTRKQYEYYREKLLDFKEVK